MAERSSAGERADVLAYLDRKIANAAKIIARSPDHAEDAQAKQRAWQIVRDDIAGGLHEGEGAAP